jgi:hypothetical protein
MAQVATGHLGAVISDPRPRCPWVAQKSLREAVEVEQRFRPRLVSSSLEGVVLRDLRLSVVALFPVVAIRLLLTSTELEVTDPLGLGSEVLLVEAS